MNIGDRIKELELEIERLKTLSTIELTNEDMKIIKFFAENDEEIKYVCFDKYSEYYYMDFKNKKKKKVVAIMIEHTANSIFEDRIDYDVNLILGGIKKWKKK